MASTSIERKVVSARPGPSQSSRLAQGSTMLSEVVFPDNEPRREVKEDRGFCGWKRSLGQNSSGALYS